MESLTPLRLRLTLLIGLLATLFACTAGIAKAEKARTAASFVDSIGVDTHTYYNDTAYRNFPLVEQRLRELGVHHIRENLVAKRPDQYEYLNALAAAGIKSTLIMGSPSDGVGGLNELVSTLGQVRGAVEAVEGPNEYDLSGDPDWMAKLGPYQAALYDRIKSDPATAALPVLGPSLGNTESSPTDISAYMDYGNVHSYPNGEEPELNLSRVLGWAGEMSGSKPVQATETGYHTALNYTGPHQPASEAAQATYTPRLFLEYYRRGIVRTFSYELLDELPDPSGHEAERSFGLLRNDFSPKPAFTALKNLTSILADEGSFTPGALDYTLGGDAADVHRVLLQKADGTYYLALWRNDRIWDNRARVAERGTSGKVTIQLGAGVSGAAEYVPNVAATPLRNLPVREGAVSVKVGAQVVIVSLGAGDRDTAAPAGRIKAWVSKRAVPSGGTLAVRGRLPVAGDGAVVTIQRWDDGWRPVARGRAGDSGVFLETLRLTAKKNPGPSRIRVVSSKAKPSHPVRVRVLAPHKRVPAIAARLSLAP